MFSGQIAFYADNCVTDERLVTEYEKPGGIGVLRCGRDCLKSQTFFSENRESAFGLVVVRSILVSRGLLGQPGGGEAVLMVKHF